MVYRPFQWFIYDETGMRKIRGTQRPDHKTHSMFPHRNPLVLTNQTPARKNGVGNANQAYTAMTKHDSTGAALSTSCGSNFDYVIAQRLLPGNYSEFSVSDTLDKCLTYKKATVSTAAGRGRDQ